MNEVERIAELEEQGYFESDVPCPACGMEMMVLERDGSEYFEGLVIIDKACPSCGFETQTYDGE